MDLYKKISVFFNTFKSACEQNRNILCQSDLGVSSFIFQFSFLRAFHRRIKAEFEGRMQGLKKTELENKRRNSKTSISLQTWFFRRMYA